MTLITPELSPVEMTVSVNGRTERLSEDEYLLLEQLIRFSEQRLSRESLQGTVFRDDHYVPDRVLEKMMARLIAKTNALYPKFPLVRRETKDTWVYTEVPPKRKTRV